MIKTLQKRFVITAMTAITVLILVLFGVINAANVVMEQREIDGRIRIISDNEGDPGRLSKPAEPYGPMLRPKDDHDMMLSSTYFVARYDAAGSMVYLDAGHIASLTVDAVNEMASAAYESGESKGRMGRFCYLIQENRNGGRTLTFLDTTDEFYFCIRILILSMGVGLVCWLLMLLLLILLSKRAIRPIAENMERQKQFITNAGHEIKTPLAIIQANADAMELYQGESKWSRNIKQQTVRLSDLTKNLLLLARMDEGKMVLASTRFSLTEAVRKMVDDFVEPMHMRGLDLRTDIAVEIWVDADREQMMQLLSILFDNACKYARENSVVEVSLRREGRQIALCVQNRCEELPNVAPEHLFERFYRADAARTQKNGGYGIGLSVAQGIVKANGGSMKAEYGDSKTIRFTILF